LILATNVRIFLFLFFCAVTPVFLLLLLVRTPYTLYLPCHGLQSKSGCLQMTKDHCEELK